MRNRVVLLPGWGMSPATLAPLAAALHGLDERLQIEVLPLPEVDSADLARWLDVLEACVPTDTWLAGWSLGGMLAAELAARRADHCCGLITLASNTCFVARNDWPHAMPSATFEAFLAGCRADGGATLKRFAMLCAQGAHEPRPLARALSAGIAPEAGTVEGLELLAALDTRAALQSFNGPQLHLFADADALVPAEAAGELLACLADVEVGLLEGTSHAFPVEEPHAVAASIHAFLQEARDD